MIKRFILKKLSEILIVIIMLLLFRLLFAIGSLDISFYNIGLEVVVFAFVIYIFISFGSYKEEVSLKADNERLTEENKRLIMNIISGRKELKDYFTLWVHQIKTPITATKMILESNMEDKEARIRPQIIYIEQYTDMAINYLKLMNTDTDMDIGVVSLDDIIKSVLKKYSVLFNGNQNIVFDYLFISSHKPV